MKSLWHHLASNGWPTRAKFHGSNQSISIAGLAKASTLNGALASFRGRSVLLATQSQLPTAAALLELDGIARRIVLCTPDLDLLMLQKIEVIAEADTIITDSGTQLVPGIKNCGLTKQPETFVFDRPENITTEWILLTSGTTGDPKLVVHTLESLAGGLPHQAVADTDFVWSTFYDIRRYGGLQIYLRAVLNCTSLVLSSPEESIGDFFTRAAACGVTHISGTPSHWRRALMSGDAQLLAPRYVRLSGEIADQALLDALKQTYPRAQVSHAFASTEAGVAFDINDGLAGFPASLLARGGAVNMKIEQGTLRIRSGRTAARYLGDKPALLIDQEGYVDTSDLVELRDSRYYFRGRKDRVINVGGHKVNPDEIETILNADPRVQLAAVHGRRSAITGALVVADIVLAEPEKYALYADREDLKNDLLAICRRKLPAHKIPARLRIVAELELTPAASLCDTMRNVIVTGGTRGLGLAMAQRFAKAGYRVIAIARNSTQQITAAIEHAAADRAGEIVFRAVDLALINEIPKTARALRTEFGPIYGLVNNAASGTGGVLGMMRDSDISKLVQLNTIAPMLLTKYVTRSMLTERTGRVINVASVAAVSGYRGLSVYSATKASMIGFTRSLARELGPLGITVNALAPGFIRTEMTQDLSASDLERIMRRNALRRMADPEDVARSAEFLLSDGGRNITGTVLTVDAGATA